MALRHHHNPQTMVKSRSFMDQESSELHRSNWRQGKVLRDSNIKIFQIETTVNNNTFGFDGPLAMMQKREWEWSLRDRTAFIGYQAGLRRMTTSAKRKIFNSWHSPYELTSVQAGGELKQFLNNNRKRIQTATSQCARTNGHSHNGPAICLPVQCQLSNEPHLGSLFRPWILF